MSLSLDKILMSLSESSLKEPWLIVPIVFIVWVSMLFPKPKATENRLVNNIEVKAIANKRIFLLLLFAFKMFLQDALYKLYF